MLVESYATIMFSMPKGSCDCWIVMLSLDHGKIPRGQLTSLLLSGWRLKWDSNLCSWDSLRPRNFWYRITRCWDLDRYNALWCIRQHFFLLAVCLRLEVNPRVLDCTHYPTRHMSDHDVHGPGTAGVAIEGKCLKFSTHRLPEIINLWSVN
jgi:hypothetical protein